MKKSISILSFVLLFSSLSCRSVTDELGLPEIQQMETVSSAYFKRDSISSSQSAGGKDDEPPRKDLQQWRQQP
ncbi:hypothetical protein [Chryseobacterium salivictor]|uniref:Uncharacterized protein n=1 Tax=Chryseobacterium salivictor TaxID=2547600 RepID=A0A4P6ZFI7_9FLAO|nr:hypothetical protein [Chryseobacterium salivictor]QBO58383.1 hypothetical protein NBC122_01568 [Chryseobacterium salivictor]